MPVDFERERFADALAATGLDAAAPAFFLWLGVTPHLEPATVLAALAALAAHPGGAEVVLDYASPTASLTEPARRLAHEVLAARAAAEGEPFRSDFDTAALHAEMRAIGLGRIEDLGPGAIAARYFVAPAGGGEPGGHVVFAATGVG